MSALVPYAGKERPRPRVGFYYGKDAELVRLWRAGLDTVDIASRVRVSEAAVYKALTLARDRERGL